MKELLLVFLIFLGAHGDVLAQRQVTSLNSNWHFASEKDPGIEKIVNIPHTWNVEDPFKGGKDYFRGTGIYTRTLYVPAEWQDRNIFLKFEGSNQVTTLFVNEQRIGQHKGGYTGFVFDISSAIKAGSENKLRIEVNNAHDPDIPPLDADFNFYGGIYRDLWLITTDKLHFKLANERTGNLLIRTPKVSKTKATFEVETIAINNTSTTGTFKVMAAISDPSGNLVASLSQAVEISPSSSKKIIFEHALDNPALWSPESPQLYTAVVSISDGDEKTDQLRTKFGFRWFEADPEKGFFLNGEPLKLIGANRHQDFQGLGNALPNELHRRDYQMIKEMGANFIRTAHYPQDPEVYRICDELGLLVWSEVPVINDVTDSESYHQTSVQMQREQILQFFNHPSIIIWGYMNEIFIRLVFNKEMSEKERSQKIKTSVALARKLEQETKRLDPYRLSAMALHENELYNKTGIASIPDIIGWNLYFGWYSKGLENFGKFLDEQHRKYPDRPLLISEYGPGADIRIQTVAPKPWDYSEAYQLRLHKSYLRQVMQRDYILGMAAWNFADFGSSFRQDSKPYINQKGLVNMDRSKKDIFFYYKALLSGEPVVYIAGKNFNLRYIKDQTEKIPISVFSNAGRVELHANGEQYSSPVQEGVAVFDIPLPEGTHRIEAFVAGNYHAREFKVRYKKNLLEQLDKHALRINVGTHVQYWNPTTENTWIPDQEYSKGSFGYIGGTEYQHNAGKFQGTPSDIQGTENDPLFQTMREGIDSYKFDVGEGYYKITLLFAEPNFSASEENLYNLSKAREKTNKPLRSFDISINNKPFLLDLNLGRDHGILRAVKMTTITSTRGGITVKFSPNLGKTLLSGIQLEKL